MTLDETRAKMNDFWAVADREARDNKDTMIVLERLVALYSRMGLDERRSADHVLGEWVLSDVEAQRFDAIALIREFRIRSTREPLNALSTLLASSDDPGAPFERQKVLDVLEELDE